MRSGSAWEPMLPLRDMQGPSDGASLAGDDARPCLIAGLPREEALGVCNPAAAEAGTRSGACLGLRTAPKSSSRPPLGPVLCMREAHAGPFSLKGNFEQATRHSIIATPRSCPEYPRARRIDPKQQHQTRRLLQGHLTFHELSPKPAVVVGIRLRPIYCPEFGLRARQRIS